ncbi:hypothetical protein DER30_1408 [Streptomyces sp. HB202]|nr:hypothetical protein DER30_1408 [Streptomyces sp. HB202]
MVQKPESDAEPKERRIDLSLPQVAGSAVAAVAAAVLASQLGVYGTIAGAGVMSVVATCGGSVFQHFFRRTGEQIREVTVQVTHPEGRQVTVHTKETTPAGRRAAAQRTEPEPTGPRSAEDVTTVLPTVGPGTVPEVIPDAESTQVLRPIDTDRTQLLDLGDERTRMLRVPPPAGGAGADADRTQMFPRADARTQMLPQAGADRAAGPDEAFGEGVTHGTRLRGWKRPALAGRRGLRGLDGRDHRVRADLGQRPQRRPGHHPQLRRARRRRPGPRARRPHPFRGHRRGRGSGRAVPDPGRRHRIRPLHGRRRHRRHEPGPGQEHGR